MGVRLMNKRSIIITAILSFFMFFLLLLTGNLPGFHSKSFTINTDSPSNSILNRLTEEDNVSQTFVYSNRSLSGFGIKFATFERTNTSDISITLEDLTTNELIYSWKGNTIGFLDNDFENFKLPETIQNVKNHTFSLTVDFTNASTDNSVALLTNQTSSEADSFQLFKNNELIEGTVVFKTYYNRIDMLGFLYFILLLFTFILLLTAMVVCFYRHLKCFRIASIRSFFISLLHNKKRCVSWIILLSIPFITMLMEYVYSHYIHIVPLSSHRLFNWHRYLFLVALFYTVFIILNNNHKARPEITYLKLSLLIGLLFVVTLPNVTYVNWDDEIHYERVIGLTGIHTSHMTQMDSALINNYNLVDFEFPVTFNISEIKEANQTLNSLHNNDIVYETEVSYSKTYEYLAYYPAAIFIVIGRWLSLPFPIQFMVGRLANLLFYSFVMYFAIKKLKTGKMILVAIAMIPTCLFLASTYNYDYWIICLVALGMSYYFTVLQSTDDTVNKRDLIIALSALVIGLGPKAIYFPLLFMLFIKSKRYKKWFLTALAVSIVFVVFSFMVPFLFNPGDMTDIRGGVDVNSPEQVKFILTNPFTYAMTLFRFFLDYLSLDNSFKYIQSFAYLGMGAGGVLYAILLLFTSLTDNGEYNKNKHIKLLRTKVLVIVLITLILVATSLYVAYTPVGYSWVSGCQPRYLLPILFPVLYVVGSSPLIHCNINRRVYNKMVFAICSLVLFYSYWNVCISRFY